MPHFRLARPAARHSATVFYSILHICLWHVSLYLVLYRCYSREAYAVTACRIPIVYCLPLDVFHTLGHISMTLVSCMAGHASPCSHRRALVECGLGDRPLFTDRLGGATWSSCYGAARALDRMVSICAFSPGWPLRSWSFSRSPALVYHGSLAVATCARTFEIVLELHRHRRSSLLASAAPPFS